ncbi:MAG: DNA starvation/stationary phase protection protein [Rickettsiales bacterium]|nr:DNA starvation/stationary phase protection protein [Rickettsiales bacterium]
MNNPVAESLKAVLADSYTLYLKTQNYHWNVTGPHFASLHVLFEQHYTELTMAIDEIAELIRGLGEKAPGSFEAFQEISTIASGDVNASAEQMVKELAADQLAVSKTVQAALEAAQAAEDEVVIGALTERLTVHRKNAWMLKSSL